MQKTRTRVTNYGFEVRVTGNGILEVNPDSIVRSDRVKQQAKSLSEIVRDQRAKLKRHGT